ncbi:MAG: IS21 family transposase [Bacilli bacterium]|nr:IS21 family transposase [Bacilli bacterium]
MYRHDVLERVIYRMNQEDLKQPPNFAELARQLDCDYRTVKAAYLKAKSGINDDGITRPPKPSKLDKFKDTIKQKLDECYKVESIFHFIKGQGYDGGRTILKSYCHEIRENQTKLAQMRFETEPGYQAQVDWKENMMLVDRYGRHHVINIFLMILGFSRTKYIELTMDKNQDTLFRCITNGICFFGGAPKEILFDNMKTVADHSRGEFGHGVINEEFLTFSRDALFEPVLCRAFRPQTKGKAENLAKIMERLRPYNGEFEDLDELNAIIEQLRLDLNSEISQATGIKPFALLEEEKKYLRMPNVGLLRDTYISRPVERKVSRESMITFCNCRYSVKPRYIGKTVTLEPKNGKLYIYLNKEIISVHKLSDRKFNFDREDYIEIMKSNAFRNQPDDMIEEIADKNLAIYDKLG